MCVCIYRHFYHTFACRLSFVADLLCIDIDFAIGIEVDTDTDTEKDKRQSQTSALTQTQKRQRQDAQRHRDTSTLCLSPPSPFPQPTHPPTNPPTHPPAHKYTRCNHLLQPYAQNTYIVSKGIWHIATTACCGVTCCNPFLQSELSIDIPERGPSKCTHIDIFTGYVRHILVYTNIYIHRIHV